MCLLSCLGPGFAHSLASWVRAKIAKSKLQQQNKKQDPIHIHTSTMPYCMHACMHAYPSTYVHTHVPTYLPTYLAALPDPTQAKPRQAKPSQPDLTYIRACVRALAHTSYIHCRITKLTPYTIYIIPPSSSSPVARESLALRKAESSGISWMHADFRHP